MKLQKEATGWAAAIGWDDKTGQALAKGCGFCWNRARKIWTTPDPEAAAALLASFRGIDEVSEDASAGIHAAVSDAVATRGRAIAASRATDANINIPAPEGLDYLPYQRAGIAFLQDRLNRGSKGVLLADEMGLGKTIQVIGLMNKMLAQRSGNRLRGLIIAPKIALIHWQRELEKWLIEPHSIAIWTVKSQLEADIVIVNYDIVRKLRPALVDKCKPWDVLACDESHALKNGKSQRTMAILGNRKELNPISARHKIFVTGTPILNRPIELFPVLNACGVDFAVNYHGYAKRYCDGHDTRHGFDASGTSNLDELQERLRSSVMVRRLKADVLSELPLKRRQVVTIDADGSSDLKKALRDEIKARTEAKSSEADAEMAMAIAEQQRDQRAYDNAIRRLSSIRASNISEFARLRQATAIAKAPSVVEAVAETLECVVDAVLVFAHHSEVVKCLAEGLRAAGYEPAIITGQSSMEERQKAQDDIQQRRKRVFIGSIHACGVAITLTAASTVIFAELDWTPGRMVQAEDRAHRIGQQNSVLVQYHVVDGSIDADMLKKSWSKAFNATQALDTEIWAAADRAGSPLETPCESELLSNVHDFDDIAVGPILVATQERFFQSTGGMRTAAQHSISAASLATRPPAVAAA